MAIQVQLRRGTATQNNAFTGAIGELSFDTTNNQIRVHDGSTAGGFKIGTGDFPTGTANVALGNTALDDLDGVSPGGNNVAVGHNALTANTTASNNVAVGSGALETSTTATDNTAVGFQALNANTSGADNVAVGDEAGHDITTGSRNVIVGSKAGDAATTTDDTTLVGYGAGGGAIMTGHDNVGVGSLALSVTTSGASNVAVGKNALAANTTGSDNIAIGQGALFSHTTGSSNTALGHEALVSTSTASSNTAVGYRAGQDNTTGANLVAVGESALANNTTASDNTAVGKSALNANTTGTANTSLGKDALGSNTTGSYNTAIGYQAADANTTGQLNVAVGVGSLGGNTTGSNNTVVGTNASLVSTTAGQNTIIGREAGKALTTGGVNTMVGDDAGKSATTSTKNTFIGQGSGYHVTTGEKNTVLGRYDGNQDNVDIRTGTNNIAISDGDGIVRIFCNNEGYSKHKNDGCSGFYGTGGAYHEFNQSNNDTSNVVVDTRHGSYASSSLYLNNHRTASSSYFHLDTLSGNNADLEHRLRGDGNAYADGSWNGGGADYAEYFEWADGNSDNQDRSGYTVVLDNEKIRIATSDDAAANIIGAVSVNPSVVGDSDIDRWKQKYLRDDFGAYQKETYTVTEWTETVVDQEASDEVLDDDGNVVTPAKEEITREVFHNYETDKIPDGITVPDDAVVSTEDANGNIFERRILNPDYNPDTAYVSREDRQEWATIGMMGKLRIRKGQPTGDRWIKMRDISDTVEEWLVR